MVDNTRSRVNASGPIGEAWPGQAMDALSRFFNNPDEPARNRGLTTTAYSPASVAPAAAPAPAYDPSAGGMPAAAAPAPIITPTPAAAPNGRPLPPGVVPYRTDLGGGAYQEGFRATSASTPTRDLPVPGGGTVGGALGMMYNPAPAPVGGPTIVRGGSATGGPGAMSRMDAARLAGLIRPELLSPTVRAQHALVEHAMATHDIDLLRQLAFPAAGVVGTDLLLGQGMPAAAVPAPQSDPGTSQEDQAAQTARFMGVGR